MVLGNGRAAMNLLRFGDVGNERPAVKIGNGPVLDVSSYVEDFNAIFFEKDGIAMLKRWVADGEELEEIDLSRTRTGACIPRPHQVWCIGLNYTDHIAEAGMDVPDEPVVFSKAPNTIVGPDDDVRLPPGADKVDWEVELGVVIGRRARYLANPLAAMECIAGYCISNDISERGWQLERGGQWIKGKSAETFNPCGPWLVPADEVDPSDLVMELWVNGQQMQCGSTKNMVFDVGYLVWYLSQFAVLEPGDLINTGTAAGVGLGRKPPKYLQNGDVMDLLVGGLGAQRQVCRRSP